MALLRQAIPDGESSDEKHMEPEIPALPDEPDAKVAPIQIGKPSQIMLASHAILVSEDEMPEENLDVASLVQDRLPPFSKFLGIKILSAMPDRVVAEMLVRADLCTTPEVLHGGAIMAFADTLGACATVINLREGFGTTTIESKTNFFAPTSVGQKVIGECIALHRGKRTMAWQSRITNENAKLIAVVTQTQMVLEPQASP